MQSSNKQFIINSIQERDKAVHKTLIHLWRLGHIKKPIKPKTLIIFPCNKRSMNKEYAPYTHSHPQEVMSVMREQKLIYLSPTYSSIALINGR